MTKGEIACFEQFLALLARRAYALADVRRVCVCKHVLVNAIQSSVLIVSQSNLYSS